MLAKNLISLTLIASLFACSDESLQKSLDDNGVDVSLADIDTDTDTDTQVTLDMDTDTQVTLDIDTDTDTDTDVELGIDGVNENTELVDYYDDSHWLNDVSECYEEPEKQHFFLSATDDGSHDGGLGPEYSIDGNYEEDFRWSYGGIGKEIIFDLGEAKRVGAIQLLWHKGSEQIYNYHIESSADNITWQRIISERSSVVDDDSGFEIIDLMEVNSGVSLETRYFKIIGLGNDSGNNENSLIEAQAFRCGSDTPFVPLVIQAETCGEIGQILYNNECTALTEVFGVDHGNAAEGAYLVSSSPVEMTFDALAAQHVSDSSNGWRHELKIKASGGYRVAMTEVYELFKAKITIDLDDGAKTIVTQHHTETTETITKLYIADLDEGGFENAPDGKASDSIAMNGIFDVYIRLANPEGEGKTKHLLTTIHSGESFYFEEENDHGVITIKINGQAIQSFSVTDSSESYFKFGNYLQAQNPETNEKLGNDKQDEWPAFFEKYFDVSKITFTELSYIRTVD